MGLQLISVAGASGTAKAGVDIWCWSEVRTSNASIDSNRLVSRIAAFFIVISSQSIPMSRLRVARFCNGVGMISQSVARSAVL